jgi:hypothetical protein
LEFAGDVVPEDDKENVRFIVTQFVLDVLGELKMTYPKATEKRRIEPRAIYMLPAQ